MASLQIRGERTSGADVRQQNTMAALAIANVLKVRVCGGLLFSLIER
jgi:hypothetical protein